MLRSIGKQSGESVESVQATHVNDDRLQFRVSGEIYLVLEVSTATRNDSTEFSKA